MKLGWNLIVALTLALAARLDAAPDGDKEAADAARRAGLNYKGNIHYPYEAKRNQITGAGIAAVSVNSEGKVTKVTMAQSTGSPLLDRATIDGLRSARFKPGTVPMVKIPVRFTMAGGGQVYDYYDVKKKDMNDVLAAFLGKGTVRKGPIPAYPRRPPWTEKSGKGVYELHADKEGKITQVRVLKSSGDAIFDREAVKTLGKWRLARGPLIIELPLRFRLTPKSYSVDVGR